MSSHVLGNVIPVPLYEYIRIKIVSREYINSKGEMEEADIRPGTIPQEGNCIN